MSDPWYAQAFGAHYPVLYQHRDAAEAAACLSLLPTLAPLSGPVLDLGCGDGRHLRLLAAAGVTATGLDLSPELLALAAKGPCVSPLVRGDMRSLPFRSAGFGTVLSLFTAFGYFGPPAANTAPIASIASCLRTGGHWFLDYFDGDSVLAELGDGRPVRRERAVGCLLVRETRCYLARERQVVKEVELGALDGCAREAAEVGVGPTGLAYTERVAVFNIAELDEMCRAEGLLRVAAAGDYTGGALGQGNRWILVYHKESLS